MELLSILATEIAKGIISTGIEGPYDAVSCSTAGDSPSMGVVNGKGDAEIIY